MKLLLDTHILVWWLTGSKSLSQGVAARLLDNSNNLHVSVASVWEAEVKAASGRMAEGAGLAKAARDLGVACLPIVEADAIAAARLPLHHRDPFDRMIVAHALNHDMTVVTHDRVFQLYPVSLLLA